MQPRRAYRVEVQKGLHGDIAVVLTPGGRVCSQFDGKHALHDARVRCSDLNSMARHFARVRAAEVGIR